MKWFYSSCSITEKSMMHPPSVEIYYMTASKKSTTINRKKSKNISLEVPKKFRLVAVVLFKDWTVTCDWRFWRTQINILWSIQETHEVIWSAFSK